MLWADYVEKYPHVQWSVDANSAWTPDVAMAFLPHITALEQGSDASRKLLRVFMLEQPFPADLLIVLAHKDEPEFAAKASQAAYDVSAWRAVAEAYHKQGCVIIGL